MNKNTQSSELSLATQLIAGTKKHFATASSLAFAGATFTPAQVESSLQTIIDLLTAVNVSKAATKAKVVAWNTQAKSLLGQMAAFESFVKVTFGNSPDVLADFGVQPNKARTPLTVEQKAAAAAKREATRAARHTMGKQQKKAVKGTITTIVTTPPSTAAASGPGSPAASGTAAGVTGATGHVTATV
jgi:hypothetical protein